MNNQLTLMPINGEKKSVKQRSSETGHAINVMHFNDLTEFAIGYEAAYSPSNPLLTVAQLQALYLTANNSLEKVINALIPNQINIDQRMIAFEGIRPLSTRIINTLEASGASKETIENAKYFNRKIQGARAVKILENPNLDEPTKHVSASQQSYTQMVQHFDGLIAVLEAENLYDPSTTDLTIVALKAKRDDMYLTNKSAAVSQVRLSNARLDRNVILYAPGKGLVDIGLTVKHYVKGVFGAKSPEYRQISGISFTKVPFL